jgi:hypothetical protein
MMFTDESSDTQARSHHIIHDPFRAPECLFQAEETVLPFKTDFAVRPVQVAALVLFHEIIRFPVSGKMNGVSLLMQVMAKMETTGCVPEPFAADNKKDLHGNSCSKNMYWQMMKYQVIPPDFGDGGAEPAVSSSAMRIHAKI